MIVSFKNKGLEELFLEGKTAKISSKFHERIIVRLDALDAATKPEDVNIPGFNFHMLSPRSAGRYTVHVNGPWCVTFGFIDGNAFDVDFEQYH
ncbi:plasmid maintenance system killer [Kaistia algarum]|uniref:type II toxin-antitoxin system RelE/ParE family toxin n=1 Tax=Kaistia algarum TaxID=2083279 RepID=UPI000CE88128|nr:type II toxin-antitoxin system RelE/ParE family toxin [Kaistia algarum]MCX5515256.1 type II toxin-antitoxin system RelE/ParE family toxin [Kaistia algarum]PPE79964.1 plasmid maintenance system killer [Kaistia algarum]